MLLGSGCDRQQPHGEPSEERPSRHEDQRRTPEEGQSQTFKKQLGDHTYVHLAWFSDDQIARQVLTKLESKGMRAYCERGLGVTSVWIIESMEADGLRVLRSDPDWMEARVKGINGFQATTEETPAGQADSYDGG